MRLAFLAALLLAAGAGPALALAQPNERSYYSVWMIQPSVPPPGRQVLQHHAYVVRQALLPPSLIRLDADAADAATGQVLVAAGSQLFGLVTAGPPVFCTTDMPESSVLHSMMIGGRNRQVCFVDTDRDGRLDASFNASNDIRRVPYLAGERPNRPNPVSGGSYTQLPPSAFDRHYFIAIRFEGIDAFNVPYFSVVFGNEQGIERTTANRIEPPPRTDPMLIRVAGAEFAITAVRGQEIDVEIRRTMTPRGFRVLE